MRAKRGKKKMDEKYSNGTKEQSKQSFTISVVFRSAAAEGSQTEPESAW